VARYDHLTVYQDTYNLNLYFFRLSRGFPKDFKYGLADELKACLSELLDHIIANSTQDKAVILQKASLTVERAKHKSRLLRDMKVMNLKSYEYFCKELVEISKQLEKWYAWAGKQKV
jgi:hypothetical protein